MQDEHVEERLRAGEHGQDSRLPHARPAARHSHARAGARKAAASWSATRPRRRCSAPCCRRIRPAYTRSGCRSIPLQIGLVLKPGPQEPWTPYRMIAAYIQAGIPAEVFCVYPGGPEAGAAVLEHCTRAMIFGGTATVERYKGNPRVQAHGPGFSKIMLGDDEVDNWPKVHRPDGREHLHQLRPRLHQLLRASGPRGTRRKSPRPSPRSSARSRSSRRPTRPPASRRSPSPARPRASGT